MKFYILDCEFFLIIDASTESYMEFDRYCNSRLSLLWRLGLSSACSSRSSLPS